MVSEQSVTKWIITIHLNGAFNGKNCANRLVFPWHGYWNDKETIRMKTLDELSDEFNIKKSQTEFLLNLCDDNLELLEELFLKMKRGFTFGVPENKEELKLTLSYNA